MQEIKRRMLLGQFSDGLIMEDINPSVMVIAEYELVLHHSSSDADALS